TAVGASHVLPASARIESTLIEPGLVRHTSPGVHGITFGEADGTMSPRVAKVSATLERGGFKVIASPSSLEEIWRKFVFMCGFSGVCAATRLSNGPILATAETRQLVVDAMREVAALARTQGFRFGEDIVTQQMGFLEKRPWGFASSMLRDVQGGRPIEVEALNGMAVRLARESGIEVPANRFIHACLKPFEHGTPKTP
ncbi:MAG TPA: ketopantoate reductase C-terminal domain-containing protein, partial [Candidatus Thermoplasmatota archaeon]